MRRAGFFPLCLLLSSSCGQPSAPVPAMGLPPAAAPAAPPGVSTSPPSSPVPAPAPTSAAPVRPAHPVVPLTRDGLRQIRAAVKEGREHARAGRHAQAVTSFERALAVLPTDMRTRCELGWSAFNAGDAARAGRELDAAISRWESVPPLETRDRNAFASCLYNRARVAEDRGDRPVAVGLYVRSLALRPNRTVEQRLQALGAPPAPAVPAAGGWQMPWPWADQRPVVSATLADLQSAIGRVQCAEAHSPDLDEEPCEASVDLVRQVQGGEGLLEAAVLEVYTETSSYGTWKTAWIVWHTAERWAALGPVADGNASGAGGTSADMQTVGLRTEALVPGGPPEIVAELRSTYSDADLGYNLMTSGEERFLVLCGLDGGMPTCWGRVLVESHSVEEWATPPDELTDEDRASMTIDPQFRPSDVTKTLTVTLGADGALTIAASTGALRAGVAGRHPLTALPLSLQQPFERR